MPQILKANDFFDSSLLPVRLYYTRRSELAGWHSHEFTEIAILFSGHATYETDFSQEEVVAGDALIIPAGGIHRYCNEADVELMNILFQFDKLPIPYHCIGNHPGFSALFRIRPDYYRQMKFYPKIKMDAAENIRLRELLLPAFEAQQQKKTGFPLTVFGAFLQSIPILLQSYGTTPIRNSPELPEKLSHCLDYMTHRYREALTVNDLARRAGLAPASFTRHFKAATGMTPLSFLVHLRLEEAEQLLRSGKYTVAEVAQATGFRDSNYFSRLFRKYRTDTPKSLISVTGRKEL